MAVGATIRISSQLTVTGLELTFNFHQMILTTMYKIIIEERKKGKWKAVIWLAVH